MIATESTCPNPPNLRSRPDVLARLAALRPATYLPASAAVTEAAPAKPTRARTAHLRTQPPTGYHSWSHRT